MTRGNRVTSIHRFFELDEPEAIHNFDLEEGPVRFEVVFDIFLRSCGREIP
jgi:hypothetical protein